MMLLTCAVLLLTFPSTFSKVDCTVVGDDVCNARSRSIENASEAALDAVLAMVDSRAGRATLVSKSLSWLRSDRAWFLFDFPVLLEPEYELSGNSDLTISSALRVARDFEDESFLSSLRCVGFDWVGFT